MAKFFNLIILYFCILGNAVAVMAAADPGDSQSSENSEFTFTYDGSKCQCSCSSAGSKTDPTWQDDISNGFTRVS